MRRDGLSVLIPEDELRAGVATLAREIDRDYAATGVVIVCVLKGAAIFTADLLRCCAPRCIGSNSCGRAATAAGRSHRAT